MRKRMIHIHVVLLIIMLLTVNFCSGQQKVAITGIDGDTLVAFAVEDIKQALQKFDYTIVDINEDIRIFFDFYEE